jgi:hypothetical protein
MARVEIDIFSGRPNPVFTLDDQEAQEVLRELASAPEAHTDAAESLGILGYRGMILELDEEEARRHSLPRALRVGGGVAGNEAKGLEIAERLVSRARGLKPAREGDFGRLGVYDEDDLQRLVREELPQVEARGRALRERSADRSSPKERTGETTGPDEVSILSGATVLGNDVIYGWTTYTLGSCGYEASAYNPGYWNGSSTIQNNNNCYNYATNRRTDTFAQPGRATGAGTSTMACSNVGNGATSDGAKPVSTCVAVSDAPRYYMALVIWPNYDYHWYRRHNGNGTNEFWGHKPGSTAARNTDNSGNVIYNPQTANRGGYTSFCGYYFGPNSMQIR